jgi:hypothetical protein
MPAANDSLHLKFRPTDSVVGVSRKTVKALALRLGVPQTQVVHLALSKPAVECLPGCEPDDGPLTARLQAGVKADAAKRPRWGHCMRP